MKQLSLPISEELFHFCEFFITQCNEEAYRFLITEYDAKKIPFYRIVLSGEKSSGKSRLAKLWYGDGLYINCETDRLDVKIHSQYERVVIDNFECADEIELLHIVNDCIHNHVVVLLITTNTPQCKLADLYSRVNSAYHLRIHSPDNEMAMLMIQEMCIWSKIKVHQNTLDYVSKYLKFNSFVDLLSFKMRLHKICENNKMILDINTLKIAYENYRNRL